MMKYSIGDNVWHASWDATTDYITCPDCAGEARIRVILPYAEHSIECEGCKRGYAEATGYIQVYTRKATATLVTITGVEISAGKTTWQTNAGRRTAEEFLFDNEADALARAQVMAAEQDAEERARIRAKEKPTKSWSWHVHYHRRCIRDAQRQIDYHTTRLNVACVKAKGP